MVGGNNEEDAALVEEATPDDTKIHHVERPTNNVVASASLHGLVIGNCLQEALQSLTAQHKRERSEANQNDLEATTAGATSDQNNSDADDLPTPRKRSKVQMNGRVAKNIIQAFGNAVAEVKPTDDSEGGDPSSTANISTPPTATLYGRLDHYNRVESDWRIVIDNVELAPSKRRESAKSLPPKGTDERLPIATTTEAQFQILAFDDL